MDQHASGVFVPLLLEAQADFVARTGLDTLLFCPHPWALRHRYISRKTGDTIRARCGSWGCLYCGPRKVDMWRQLVKLAEPTLHVVLTKVGWTLKEASRTYATVLQYLRRGSKGRGKEKIGARPAYPIQVFAVLEEHSDFEQNGFHWHLLVKGVDFLPNQVVSDALRSATGGRSWITRVRRVQNQTAVGYVTKYLMKEIARERRGLVDEERTIRRVALDPVAGHVNEKGHPYLFEARCDSEGQVVMEEERRVVQRLCKAHRIRYSKQFFPAKTAVLRQQLFGEQPEQAEREDQGQTGVVQGETGSEKQEECSEWMLYEVVSPVQEEQDGGRDNLHLAVVEKQHERLGLEPDLEGERYETRVERYQRMRREALIEALERVREGEQLYSRRIVGIWGYQREQLRLAG